MRVIKCESLHSRSAMSGGMSGRRRSMSTSSIAADDMCVCFRRDWMACACGMRAMATDAILCCVAVGGENRWSS